MKTIVFKMMPVLLMAFTFAACAKKSSNSQVRTSGARDTNVTVATTCANGQSSIGQLYDDGTSSGKGFRERVGDFLSATVNPDNFGDIAGALNSTPTGVDFILNLRVDGSGNVVDGSKVQFVIYDSYVGQTDSSGQVIQAYPITMSTGMSGTYNRTSGTFNVTFSDDYGSVNIQGTANASMVRGKVNFTNTKHFSGGTPASGYLGAIAMPGCGLLR